MKTWTVLYAFDGGKSYEHVRATSKRAAKRAFLAVINGRWNVEILDVYL